MRNKRLKFESVCSRLCVFAAMVVIKKPAARHHSCRIRPSKTSKPRRRTGSELAFVKDVVQDWSAGLPVSDSDLRKGFFIEWKYIKAYSRPTDMRKMLAWHRRNKGFSFILECAYKDQDLHYMPHVRHRQHVITELFVHGIMDWQE